MLLLTVAAIALMVMDKRVTAIENVRAALSMPLAPLQYLVSWPIQFIDKLHDTVGSYDALMKENMNLKAEQLRLKAQVQRFLAIQFENNQLKALRQSSAKIQGKVLIAQLMAVAFDPFNNQVVLNKGSHYKVYKGQPVLDANGVMGQIIEVGPFTSRVLLINDSKSGVPVQVVRNGVRAIAIGDTYSGKLRLINITKTADIQPNDVLITSGLGDTYPEGYPVGKVLSITNDPGSPFSTIIVEPAAKLDRSRGVLLVWPTVSNNLR